MNFRGSIFHDEFQHNLLRDLWNTWKSIFTALCKLGVVVDHPTISFLILHTEFHQNLLNHLCNRQKSLFMARCKLSFIADKYGGKSEKLYRFS
jgi:hypothetical protein